MRLCRRLAAVVALAASGCAAQPQADVLLIDAGAYREAFDAAVEAGRSQGMPPALRDRRRGVIETEPRYAGSILEPWRTDNETLGQAVESTIAFQRRRARFEFTAPRLRPDEPGGAGPDLLATRSAAMDLTQYDGLLELRVMVFVERSYTPGLQYDTWSSVNTSRAVIDSPSSPAEAGTEQYWAPVTRDVDYEHRLLAGVRSTLGK